MTNALQNARETLLEPAGIGAPEIDRVLGRLLTARVDYADLYFQYARRESWALEEGTVKSGSYGIEQGAGVRAVSGDKTGFAYSDELRLPALTDAADAARAIARHPSDSAARGVAVKRAGAGNGGGDSVAPARYAPLDPLASLADAEKVQLLRRVEQVARDADPRVSEVMVSLAAAHDVILVARSDGHLAADIRPLVRLNVSVIVEENGKREQGFWGGGGRYGYPYLTDRDSDRAADYARQAVAQALVQLEAQDAPAGEMTVVLGPGWPGILLHEAIGHGLEGDFNRKKTSAFSGRIGDQVASELCTVVDDGSLENRRGSLSIDDEGEATGRTVLIENGILKGYMQDQLNARLMNMPPTGNGRRESFAHLPMPRMTNTFMLAGKHHPGDIIASVDDGLYAVNFSGGQVDITSGKFVFSAAEAYRIKGGKVAHPVKGATLIGNGPEVLTRVSMLGDDLELDSGVGVCGKDGQSVPVGVGQPTMKIDRLTVGGVAV
ncbi:MAG: metalloprotease TldD [Gammaproteobacteria bacterium]|nr:metalloprotease TldD [Gammaproteobacteria bacterium]